MEEHHDQAGLSENINYKTPEAMQSNLKTVDLYMESVPEERRTALTKLREYCRKYLKGYEESMEYGMPSYKRNNTAEVAFNSQKNYISLYILNKSVLDQYRDELSPLSVGKGCIRYSNPKQINFGIVEKLLKGTHRSKETICPR